MIIKCCEYSFVCVLSGQRSRTGPLSANNSPRVAQRPPAPNPQNASHPRTPGPQQDATLLPRHEGERHGRWTGRNSPLYQTNNRELS